MELIISLVLAELKGIPIVEDVTFWHLISIIACGIVIKMLHRHLDKTEETLKDIKSILNELVTKGAVHDVKLDQHEKRIEQLENG